MPAEQRATAFRPGLSAERDRRAERSDDRRHYSTYACANQDESAQSHPVMIVRQGITEVPP